MEYRINPKEYCNVFAVPSAVVDKHIKLAGSAQLKVLLWFLRNSNSELSFDAAKKALGLPESDIKDAFLYWEEAEIILSLEPKKVEIVPPPQEQKPVKSIATAKPSREDTLRRGQESPEIAFLLKEAQLRLGRFVSQSEASTLVWLHDNEGLPIPVILMSIQYAISENKTSFRYIEKMCCDWAAKDINTLEAAEKKINELYLSKTSWHIVESAFGIEKRKPSENELKYCLKWINEWGYNKDMLCAAYNDCVDSIKKLSFPYMDKIIDKWYKNNIKTLKQVEEFKTSTKKEKATPKSTSYDIETIKKRFRSLDDEE